MLNFFKLSIVVCMILVPCSGLTDVRLIDFTGFRDFKIGRGIDDINQLISEHCEEVSEASGPSYRCYNYDDISFRFGFVENEYFDKDMDTYNLQRVISNKFELQVGMDRSQVEKNCVFIVNNEWNCESYQFFLKFSSNELIEIKAKNKHNHQRILNNIEIDIGPLHETYLDPEKFVLTHPYRQLRETLDKKYRLDWEFTDRDRILFNAQERDNLFVSYRVGQIFIEIERDIESSKIRLFVRYYSFEEGRRLFVKRHPNNVNFNDF